MKKASKNAAVVREQLKAQRSRSGEWEVVTPRNIVMSNGFDSQEEAEAWIEERARRFEK